MSAICLLFTSDGQLCGLEPLDGADQVTIHDGALGMMVVQPDAWVVEVWRGGRLIDRWTRAG